MLDDKIVKTSHDCQCGENAVDHVVGACMKRARRQFLRENKRTNINEVLWLCDECVMTGWDTEVE